MKSGPYPYSLHTIDLGLPRYATARVSSPTNLAARLTNNSDGAWWNFLKPQWMSGKFKIRIFISGSGAVTKNCSYQIYAYDTNTSATVIQSGTVAVTFYNGITELTISIDSAVKKLNCMEFEFKAAEALTINADIYSACIDFS